MTPTNTPEVARLAEELRDACMKIRVKASIPLSALIPIMQRAADKLERLAAKQDAAPTSASTVPAGYWLAPMMLDVTMLKAAGNTPGMKAIDSSSATMQLRGYPLDPKAFEGGAPLAQAWIAMRDSWIARNHGACSVTDGEANPSVPLSAIRPIAVEAIREVMGCPDVIGSGGASLVEALEQVAQAAAKRLGADGEAKK